MSTQRRPFQPPDLTFGQIAVKVGLLTQPQVEVLLAEQAELRRQRRFAPLGELAQMKGLLSSRQVQRVLLAQEFYHLRHADELLAAILDMRGDVGEGTLRTALDQQMETYQSEDKVPRPLGETLVEMGVLTPEKLLEVMTEHPEVRRAIADRKTDVVQGAEAAPPAPAPPAWLVQETGMNAGRAYRLGRKAVLGRQASNEVSLDDPRASRQHAQVYFDPGTGRHVILDLSSVNGTLVNDRKIEEQTELKEGALIRVGETALRYTLREPAPRPAAPAPASREPSPPRPPGRITQARKRPTVFGPALDLPEDVTDEMILPPPPKPIPLAAVVSASPDADAPPAGADLRTRLQYLVDLRLLGKITAEEFRRRRKELLSEP